MLLDTSGLLILHHADAPRHDEARELFDAAGPKLVHSYVLAELVALAHARGLPRGGTLAFLGRLAEQPDVEAVWVDETLHRNGMSFLANRLDKDYSLADAISFLLMRQYGVTEALTTDHHFEQEGFVRLLGRSA